MDWGEAQLRCGTSSAVSTWGPGCPERCQLHPGPSSADAGSLLLSKFAGLWLVLTRLPWSGHLCDSELA